MVASHYCAHVSVPESGHLPQNKHNCGTNYLRISPAVQETIYTSHRGVSGISPSRIGANFYQRRQSKIRSFQPRHARSSLSKYWTCDRRKAGFRRIFGTVSGFKSCSFYRSGIKCMQLPRHGTSFCYQLLLYAPHEHSMWSRKFLVRRSHFRNSTFHGLTR